MAIGQLLDNCVGTWYCGIVLAGKRGLGWEHLSEEARERLIDELLHEAEA